MSLYKLPEGLTLDLIMEAVEDDDNRGFCLNCGAEHDCCEPDARNYHCDSCDERRVYGAAELLIMFA